MQFDQVYIDVLRALHLACFAAGMGTGLYFDFRTYQTMNDPITSDRVVSLEQIHLWISRAFMGLWVTGLVLIYERTGMDVAAFSPKLWVKITLMVIMTWNARKIATYVLPLLRANTGVAMIDLPARQLSCATQIAVTSIFGWTSGMMLGSSAYLKSAPWEVVVPVAVGWFVVLTVVGHVAVALVRARVKAAREQRQEQLVFDYG